MSEIALYRKYRPEKFKDVIGQDHVVSVLEGAIKEGKTAHAYLFSGTRGTGKTSIARIFARELGTDWKDLYEIDGASNRGIDEIRELREAVHTMPFSSPHKVYIIDEVHMLTTPAFNALLKTLEEPPGHVIFILATTELHKVPDTVASRCQPFTFKTPTEEFITKALSKIAKAEGFELEKDALALISLLGDGSFRDAIGMLQKVFSISSDNKLTVDEVEKITGAPKSQLIKDFIEGALSGDQEKSLMALSKAKEATLDMKVFTKMSLRLLRFAMLYAHAPDMKKTIEEEVSSDELQFIEDLKKLEGAKRSTDLLRELLDAYQNIDYAYIKQLPLELAIIKFLEKGE